MVEPELLRPQSSPQVQVLLRKSPAPSREGAERGRDQIGAFGENGELVTVAVPAAPNVTDGSENLVGALRQSMAALGARTIREMQAVEMVYAPSTQTEGKSWQRAR